MGSGRGAVTLELQLDREKLPLDGIVHAIEREARLVGDPREHRHARGIGQVALGDALEVRVCQLSEPLRVDASRGDEQGQASRRDRRVWKCDHEDQRSIDGGGDSELGRDEVIERRGGLGSRRAIEVRNRQRIAELLDRGVDLADRAVMTCELDPRHGVARSIGDGALELDGREGPGMGILEDPQKPVRTHGEVAAEAGAPQRDGAIARDHEELRYATYLIAGCGLGFHGAVDVVLDELDALERRLNVAAREDLPLEHLARPAPLGAEDHDQGAAAARRLCERVIDRRWRSGVRQPGHREEHHDDSHHGPRSRAEPAAVEAAVSAALVLRAGLPGQRAEGLAGVVDEANVDRLAVEGLGRQIVEQAVELLVRRDGELDDRAVVVAVDRHMGRADRVDHGCDGTRFLDGAAVAVAD
ncbi:MAG: hypothetical protein ABI867_18165, partial [Kofleriaceae bacterium]